MSTRKQDSQQPTPAPAQQATLVDTVKAYLDDKGWSYELSERDEGERVLLTTRIHVEPVVSRTVFDIGVSRNRLGIFAYVPFTVPVDHRMAVMEYLTRANYRLFLAKFEFDLSDGEWRALCPVIPDDSALTVAMVRRMRHDVHSAIEHYAPGVLAIMYGQQTAQQAWQAMLDREAAEASVEESDTAEAPDAETTAE